MEKLKEIFDLCIEKGLNFDFNPETRSFSVHDRNSNIYKRCYYGGKLKDYEDDYTLSINNIIELIKTYKNE